MKNRFFLILGIVLAITAGLSWVLAPKLETYEPPNVPLVWENGVATVDTSYYSYTDNKGWFIRLVETWVLPSYLIHRRFADIEVGTTKRIVTVSMEDGDCQTDNGYIFCLMWQNGIAKLDVRYSP